MRQEKPFEISQQEVLGAYKKVKANRGAPGIDGVDFEEYEKDLKNNLYKLWNRMSSGSYFPQAVRGVSIPKKSGEGERLLGIPTINDRVAQMVVYQNLAPTVEPIFYENSYGYRPGKSAVEAVAVTRERCWKYDWLIEFDIKGLFDNIDHELLMQVVRKHAEKRWVVLYIERFLKAPMVLPDGQRVERTAGTPQGGVISAILANLFMHYAFDCWMETRLPRNPWVRYADDGVIHCNSKEEAEIILKRLKNRLSGCKLELHPTKTRIVYCKDDNRRGNHEHTSFDFLGYTFRRRMVRTKKGQYFCGFNPAVSKSAVKSLKEKIKRLRRLTQLTIEELAEQMNPIIRGWANYFSKFTASEVYKVLSDVNLSLARWVMRKYKRFKRRLVASINWLGKVAATRPNLFTHWEMGIRPTAG